VKLKFTLAQIIMPDMDWNFTSCKPVAKAYQIWVSFVLKGQQNHSYRQLDCLYVMDFTSWI